MCATLERRCFALICLHALLGLLAASGSARAISNGLPVSGQDPIRAVAVSVYSYDDDCSGVKIASDLILTAKHCTINKTTRVIFGDGSAYKVAGFFLATAEPSAVKAKQDVAVLKIDGNVPGPVALLGDRSSLPKDGATAWTAGYGGAFVTRANNPLRKARVVIANSGYAPFLTAVQVANRGGICDGDSGGPGYTQLAGQIVVWGVDSASVYGMGCAARELYATITLEEEWLQKLLQDRSVQRGLPIFDLDH